MHTLESDYVEANPELRTLTICRFSAHTYPHRHTHLSYGECLYSESDRFAASTVRHLGIERALSSSSSTPDHVFPPVRWKCHV